MQAPFTRQQRILTSSEFQRVFRQSRRVSDNLFMVCARFQSTPPARLGLAISKKHARRAVDRNRLKRHARETFRRNAAALRPGDYIIVNKPAATDASNQSLRRSLSGLLAQLQRKTPRRTPRDSA